MPLAAQARVFLTSRDHALRLTLSLVLGTEAVLFGVVLLLSAIASSALRGKLVMLLAGLLAAHVVAALLLAAWTLALPRWRRDRFARLTSGYWYFVAIAWLFVGAVVSAHRS